MNGFPLASAGFGFCLKIESGGEGVGRDKFFYLQNSAVGKKV